MEANEKKHKDADCITTDVRHQRRFTYNPKTMQKKSAIPNNVTDVIIDSLVEVIRESAFFYCSALVHVDFSDAPSPFLQTISSSAFQYCTGLQLVSLPSSLITIGPWAFSGCTSLAKVEWLPVGVNGGDSMLQTIGGYAFAGCQSLSCIKLPKQVTKLSQGAFQGCFELRTIHLSPNLNTIGSCALEQCVSLESISIPKTVTSIGTSVFAECHSLQQVDFCHSGQLRTIGRRAFAGCRSLSAICIPTSVIEIGSKAFLGCIGLLGLEIPASSKVQLERSCFADCVSLITVSIPSSVTYLPYNVFSNSHAMRKHVTKEPGESSTSSVSLHPVLRSRYQGLPAHHVCYHAATCTMEDLTVAMQLSNSDQPDVLGMTPLHVLATISTVGTDFFHTLLSHYSLDVIWHKDVNGQTMMGYLMLPHRSCQVIPLIQLVLHRIIIAEMKTNHPWGLPSWMNAMAGMIDSIGKTGNDDEEGDDAIGRKNDFKSRQQDLRLVQEASVGYFKLEATSMLELETQD